MELFVIADRLLYSRFQLGGSHISRINSYRKGVSHVLKLITRKSTHWLSYSLDLGFIHKISTVSLERFLWLIKWFDCTWVFAHCFIVSHCRVSPIYFDHQSGEVPIVGYFSFPIS